MHPTVLDRRLALLIAAYILLGLIYGLVTPPWETPDEPWHMGYVAWLRNERRLPPLSLDVLETPVHQEASQPPLFYLLAALASLPQDVSGGAGTLVENPFRFGGVGLHRQNHTYALHGGWDAWETSAYIRALHLARLVALAMGALAVWATWRLACEVLPERRDLALAAAGLVAFNPQFLFLGGSVSNDTTAAALCTLALWRSVALIHRPTARSAALLGITLGLAWLAKSSALALAAVAGAALLVAVARSPRRLDSALRLGIPVFGVAALVGGWWYARNLLVYHTLLGQELHLAMPWARPSPASLLRLARDHEFWLVFVSYWAAFGWGTIRYPDQLYVLIGLVGLAAVVGLGLGAWRWWRGEGSRRARLPWGLLLAGLWGGLVLVSLVRWMQLVKGHWGRLYFPAIGATALMLVVGLDQLAPRRRLPALAVGGLAILAVCSPWLALWPTLRPPPQVRPEVAAAAGDPVGWRIDSLAELLSFTPATLEQPADSAWPVTACWRVLAPTSGQYAVFVHLVRPVDRVVASLHSIPAAGTFPTPAWRAGDAFCDDMAVLIGEDVPPGPYEVVAGLFDPVTKERLPTFDGNGHPVEGNLIGHVKIVPADGAPFPAVTIPHPLPGTRLDEPPSASTAAPGAVRLAGYTVDAPAGADRVCPGQSLTLSLFWQPLARLADDYTVFVQLRPSSGGAPIAQADGPARVAGDDQAATRDYPTTLWSVGETISDRRVIKLPGDIPPGDYTLAVGMYRLGDMVRLPVRIGGQPAPADEVRLPAVQVGDGCD